MPDELDLLRSIGGDLAEPSEESVERSRRLLEQHIARAATSEPKPRGAGSGEHTRARRGLRLAPMVAVLAVIGGIGLGFDVGSKVTPTEAATASVTGSGFLPARGWTVVQSRAESPRAVSTAVAANIALAPGDDLKGVPTATLATLPPSGVVIVASFRARGDPGEDVNYRATSLPLTMANAEPVPAVPELLPSRRKISVYRLRAGVDGYNVDALLFFGSSRLSQRAQELAQEQLSRLVIGSERVTISARPMVVPGSGRPDVTLFGSVDNGKRGEVVDIQTRDCGQRFFRGVAGATTVDGGGWSTQYFPGITTTLRAVWDGVASAPVTVRQRAFVSLTRSPSGHLEVWVKARVSLWRKRVVLQQLDRRVGQWRTVRSVVLTEQAAAGTFAAFGAKVKITVPRGTVVRAVLPASQARPCYLSGASRQLRT